MSLQQELPNGGNTNDFNSNAFLSDSQAAPNTQSLPEKIQ